MASINIFALSILASYFALIAGLFGLIARSLCTLSSNNVNKSRRHWLFILLTIASFAHTWYYMFAFMHWSYLDYLSANPTKAALIQRISDWLENTALFEQAWAAVCEGKLNWWWSEQLCLFTTGPWTIFLFVESRRRQIPHAWAYMVLGQVVAISVAVNLFYAAVLLSPITPATLHRRVRSPITLYTPILISLFTVYLSHTLSSTPYFLINLLTMHALLILPLILPAPHALSISTSALYFATSFIILIIRQHTAAGVFLDPSTVHTAGDFLSSLSTTLHSHPAQSSIGYDVLWTTLSYLLWEVVTHSDMQDELQGGKGAEGGRIVADTVANFFATVATTVGVVASGRAGVREVVLTSGRASGRSVSSSEEDRLVEAKKAQ